MTYLVVNCNDWLGFHIVNTLLENDFNVDGIEDQNKNDHLSMFFGRNSSFSFVDSTVKRKYDTVIYTGDEDELKGIQSERKVFISDNNTGIKGTSKKSEVYINTPFLFGEWMPMDEKGVYRNQEYIPFESELFKTTAVYINHFTKGLVQWLKTPELSQVLEVKSAKQTDKDDVKFENSIYLRDNIPIMEDVKKVLDHYQLYKDIY